jgi:hypothetical protein
MIPDLEAMTPAELLEYYSRWMDDAGAEQLAAAAADDGSLADVVQVPGS